MNLQNDYTTYRILVVAEYSPLIMQQGIQEGDIGKHQIKCLNEANFFGEFGTKFIRFCWETTAWVYL